MKKNVKNFLEFLKNDPEANELVGKLLNKFQDFMNFDKNERDDEFNYYKSLLIEDIYGKYLTKDQILGRINHVFGYNNSDGRNMSAQRTLHRLLKNGDIYDVDARFVLNESPEPQQRISYGFHKYYTV